MEEVKEPEKEVVTYAVPMCKESSLILSSIMEANFPIVTIKYQDKVVGRLPEVYLMIFEYFVTMSKGKFKEAFDINKTITISDEFTLEQSQFFVDIIPKLFLPDLQLSNSQLCWITKFFDTFIVNQEIGESFFNNININNLDTLQLLDCIISVTAGREPANNMKRLLTMTITNMNINTVQDIRLIGRNLFTYSMGRNIIIQFLKSNKLNINNETDLFIELVKKVQEINKAEEKYKISEKAFLDLMSCIRWFYVDKRKVVDMTKEIIGMFPQFHITNSMESGFNRRKALVDKYNDLKGTFKYNKDIHGLLDARDSYSYSKKIMKSGKMNFHSTTKYPFLVSLDISTCNIRKKGCFLVIRLLEPEKLTLSIQIKKGGSQIVEEKKWTFSGKSLFIPIGHEDNTFIITVKKAY